MPWHQKPMKDVISCDKLRVGANKDLNEYLMSHKTRK